LRHAIWAALEPKYKTYLEITQVNLILKLIRFTWPWLTRSVQSTLEPRGKIALNQGGYQPEEYEWFRICFISWVCFSGWGMQTKSSSTMNF
jgi:hypothetical protein